LRRVGALETFQRGPVEYAAVVRREPRLGKNASVIGVRSPPFFLLSKRRQPAP
jgi:hypothetical protein